MEILVNPMTTYWNPKFPLLQAYETWTTRSTLKKIVLHHCKICNFYHCGRFAKKITDVGCVAQVLYASLSCISLVLCFVIIYVTKQKHGRFYSRCSHIHGDQFEHLNNFITSMRCANASTFCTGNLHNLEMNTPFRFNLKVEVKHMKFKL